MTDPLAAFAPQDLVDMARKMSSSIDTFAKMSVLEERVPWEDRHRALWSLVASGHYEAHADPLIWFELAGSVEVASTEAIVGFLTTVQEYDTAEVLEDETADESDYDDYEDYYDDYDYDDYEPEPGGFQSQRITSFWPTALDILAMHACARDPEYLKSRASECHPDVQRGLQLVRRRFQRIPVEELPPGTLEDLAEHFVWTTFPWSLWDVVDGELTHVVIGRNDEEARVNRARFFSHFADEKTWGQAVFSAIFSRDYSPQYYERTRPAWIHCPLSKLPELIQRVSVSGEDRADFLELIAAREESAEDLLKIAEEFHSQNRPMKAELVALAAGWTARRRGLPVPDAVLDFIFFQNFDYPTKRWHFYSLPYFADVLGALEEERVVERLLAGLNDPQWRSLPFPLVHLYAHVPRVLDRALETAETIAAESSRFNDMTQMALSLGLLAPEHLPALAQAHSTSDNAMARDTYRRAVMGILADNDITPDPSLDPLISIVDLEEVGYSENTVYYDVSKDYQAALAQLPRDRAIARVTDDMDPSKPHWIRVVAALQALPVDELLEPFFHLLTEIPLPSSNFDWFRRFLQDLPDEARHFLGRTLATSRDPELHNTVAQGLGQYRYDELLEDAGAEAAADENPADRLRRLCADYFEAHPDAPRVTIFALHPQETRVDDGTLNRLWGPPVGITAASWPHFRDDPDHPMHHVLTLDLNTIPALRERYPDVRAISFFVVHPSHHEAYEPGNDSVALLFISDEDAEEFQGPLLAEHYEPPQSFVVSVMDVPTGAGSPPEVQELGSKIWNAIYSLPAWGGDDPIWLQHDEYHGDFLMQFDERFASMNLGDHGIMYLFADTAFFQCH